MKKRKKTSEKNEATGTKILKITGTSLPSITNTATSPTTIASTIASSSTTVHKDSSTAGAGEPNLLSTSGSPACCRSGLIGLGPMRIVGHYTTTIACPNFKNSDISAGIFLTERIFYRIRDYSIGHVFSLIASNLDGILRTIYLRQNSLSFRFFFFLSCCERSDGALQPRGLRQNWRHLFRGTRPPSMYPSLI